MNRENQILARAKILLAIESGASNEEIYALSEIFEKDRLLPLMDIVKDSNKEGKVQFLSEFLVEKFPEEKKLILIEAIRMSGNWNNRIRTENLLVRYLKEIGEDKAFLVEKLAHYLKYESKNIDKIRSLVEQINAITEEE